MDSSTTIESLRKLAAEFRDARDWKQFHNPKDLAMDISIEANELMELFLWKNSQEMGSFINERRGRVEEELADVVIGCLLLSDALGLDLSKAVEEKLEHNSRKYPVEKCRGIAKKYDEL
jgi:NTP pyrophosphatase (non-canonical NTP hydrolase)